VRILVGTIEPDIQSLLKTQLNAWGYQVGLAETSQQVSDLYTDHYHDLILIDRTLPGHNSVDLIKRIRKIPAIQKPYIIILTDRQEGATAVAGTGAGADDLLVKPIQIEVLRTRILAAERIRRLEQELRDRNQSLEIANTKMKADLKGAARIQQSFLPHNKPLFEQVAFEWGLLPCDELAGDTLNILALDENHAGFYLVDVSGHGVAAALLAMTLLHSLSADKSNSVLYRPNPNSPGDFVLCSPAEVSVKLNHQFPMDDVNGQYFTYIYGLLDLTSLQVTYTAAGHPGPVVIKSNGQHQSWPTTGMPIGFMPDAVFENKCIQLAKGDRLYCFSDGIPEAINKYEEQFGQQRMLRILQENCTPTDLGNSIDQLAIAVIKWRSHAAIQDDVSILGLEILM